MALFTDGPACTIDDLVAEDSGLLETAQTVGINVTSKLKLAVSEVQSELTTLLAKLQPTPAVNQVVVTTDLARWEKMQALAMVYRDAAYTQLIDRYKSKWDMFVKLTCAAKDQFTVNGVGLVNDPLPKAELPVLGTIPADSQSGGTFYACVAWVNAAGQEGGPSDAGSIVVPANNAMTVMASDAPANATGFNVYAGTVLAMLTLQNTTPVGPGGSFTYVPGGSSSSKTPGTGQAPDSFKMLPATTQRG
ncbi:MAG TPA: hypothetical protein VHC90_23795 [Bryobacteraceae bacterium]|nr:hypothetical protein [Bryobacteraceae bacterium]